MFYEFEHLGSPDYLKFEKGENYNFPLHLHQCFELIIITEGEMKISVASSEYNLKKGEALLIFPNQIHSLESANSKHILCIFSPRLVEAFNRMRSGKLPLDNRFVPSGYICDNLPNFATATTTTFKKGLLYSACAEFDKNASYRDAEPQKEKLLFSIFSFVEENFKQDCTLTALSTKSGYDYSYLSRYFKKIVGISFNNYVNNYRISHACYLLKNTDNTILASALESGFGEIRSFNRNFKAVLGITPAEYRKNNT